MYGVKFVGDDELPEGHDFVLCRGVRLFGQAGELVEGDDQDVVLFLKQSKITERTLERGWTAFCHVATTKQRPRVLRSA